MLLTILCTVFLFITGLSLFDSIAHAMTIVATGGFSTKDMSIGFFDSIYTEMVVMFFYDNCIFYAFIYLFQTMKGKFSESIKKVLKYNFSLFLIFVSTVVITFWLQKYYEVDFLQALRISAFATISISTGSGFSTYDFEVYGDLFTTLLFLFLMLIGRCSRFL